MKKLVTACLVTLLAAGSLSAVENNIDFYLPEGLTDWVRIEGTGVNLRKEPSASAPRLMYEYPEEDCGYGTMKWGQRATSRLEPVHGGGTDIYPMLDRNHDYRKYDDIPDGVELWVKLAYFNPMVGSFNPVWVKQSFCNIMPVTSLNADNYYANGYQEHMLHIRKGGRYDGLCLFMAKMYKSMDDPEGLFIGKLIDGKVILPLQFSGYLTEISDAKGFEFGQNFRGNTYMGYPTSYVVDADDGNGNGSLTVDLSKLTDADIDKILEHSNPIEGWEIMLVDNPFTGGYYQFELTTEPDDTGKRSWAAFSLKKFTEPLAKEGNPRVVKSPGVSYINSGTRVDRVLIQPDATTLEMSFVNSGGLTQWNINRDAYITCDATPDVKYRLLRTRGVNISPKPTVVSGNRDERISFSMSFEAVPLYANTITLVEGPSKDNFHANDIDIRPTDADNATPAVVETSSSTEIVSRAEIAPSFPGGNVQMYSWLAKNIVYPPMAAEKKVKGRVVVQFVVLSDGSIGETKVIKSVDADLDKEAVRVVKAMPKWNPGTVNGKPVNVWYTMPINFNIQ